jgi:ATP-dependent helicase HepA
LEAAIDEVIRDLLDRHGTGRVLFRNTRTTVSGFPERRLNVYPLPEADGNDSPGAPTVESDANEERLSDWLVRFLQERRGQKVLVIGALASTAVELETRLRRKAGLTVAAFHEGMSLLDRDRAAARFADEDEGVQVLICSEIGSEGRNFQFAHHLVLLDLPPNPDLLEQRIGRLDRIGQRETVEIHLPFQKDSAISVLMRFYHEGLDAFEQTCPAGQSLYERFESRLLSCMQNPGDQDGLEHLLTQTRQARIEALQALKEGRDRLLELNSFNEKRAEQIIDRMIREERRQELSSFMEKVFDQVGVEQEHHSANAVVLKPGDHMLVHHFPRLPDDGMTATFQREFALAREDVHFLTWEHPMVIGAMDFLLNGEFGNTAFCTLKLPPLKPGTTLLEANFTLTCPAPPGLQLQRFLPLTTIRLLIDHRMSELGGIIGHAHLNRLARETPIHQAREAVRRTRPRISGMIRHAVTLADTQRLERIESAVGSMKSELENELRRLRALSRVNPNIRQEEIEVLEGLPDRLETHLRNAQIKLDAIRVAMVSE